MKKILVLLTLLPLFTMAQTGMQFEHNTTWKTIQEKAKKENKYIFMDAFTTWCGPCKFMAANIFPLPEAGVFFNDKFINVKVQLDTTKKDNEEVKSWYADAHQIMKQYNVNVFPTYLFFSPDGKLVHRAVGSSDIKAFIAKGADAMNPQKQYYTLLDQYKGGAKSPEFLRNMAYAASDVYDKEMIEKASNEYLATQTDMFTPDNLEFISKFTKSSKDKGFDFIKNNTQKFDAVKGAGTANTKLVGILLQEEVFPKIFGSAAAPDWTALQTSLLQKYPGQADELTATAKVFYYQYKKDWNAFQTVIVPYMNKYGQNVPAGQLNEYAWTVFENCKDMTCVKEALEWSKRSFKDKEEPMFIDTYANLLYKMGNVTEAIKWQEKAIALVAEAEKASYRETLEKMKKGEKTWVN